MLKIAIDSGPLTSAHSVRGIGVYARELMKAMGIEGVDVSKADLSKYDIVHFTSFKPFVLSLPFYKPAGTKFVITIYDLIPLLYPKHYPSGIKGWIIWQINKFLIRNNADAIITISETSKKDICRLAGVDPEKVFVTYLAQRSLFRKQKTDGLKLEIDGMKLPKKFALYVGDVNYNKNIPNLVKACKLADIPLVIAGKEAYGLGKIDLEHAELGHLKSVDWSGVVRLGFVPDETLVTLYNLAAVYVQASFYEGFGLPILEALACKASVAVAKNQCHVEILGLEMTYFDPHDPKDIAEKILKPNNEVKLPRKYLWSKTAKETLAIYEKI